MRFLLWLGLVASALGNDTGINSGEYGPAPLGEFKGEESVIRMVEEKIEIHFGKTQSEVACRFVFRSGKAEGDAKQVVGFPDFIDTETDTGTITKLETFINGEKVEAKKQRGWFYTPDYETPRSGLGEPPKELVEQDKITRADFFTVEVVFPQGKDVIIERRYTADNGGNVMQSKTFSYTTFTGAVWKDTIGKAEFSVKLEGWTVNDLAFEDGPQKNRPRAQDGSWCSPNKAEWTVVSPTELKMTWLDFEPAVHKTRRRIHLATWSKPAP
ncbi:hypothetical protein [Haloferula sp. BvORR071]|uniref:hypothetical protein n=1 Tax=Haloferula sp. BvORR071 TaxID=1396141 RepID=UPI002240FCE4|nr:hypothetical protein [Haloferula sp. BvORR071]